ncbi:MAG: glycosidase [Anaerolineae bacterium]|nr:glycosidase [Anaerolineae bacterium]MCX8066600.1 glycosidase [Anaerolineae bacterium]MDW7991350.1 glycosidase [Anaerolineae bacterium]
MELKRHPANPILKPDPLSEWEALNVFNCAVVYHNGLFHMLYRAQGVDYVSRIGYAVSVDGVHFNRLREPVLSPQGEWETRGVEDPRVTYLEDEGRFIMAYTAYSPKGITPMFAESTNLITWQRIGPLVVGEDNKDHVLFPRKIRGRYVSFHRRPPSIWIAWSDDLREWRDFQVVMEPRPENWDCKRVGAGGVPIETPYGWLVLYHAYDFNHVYRLGACLLDLEDPTRVIARPKPFLLQPEETWELKGDVPNVVFSAANPVVDGTVYVYYGGADRVIGLATCSLEELLEWVRHEG